MRRLSGLLLTGLLVTLLTPHPTPAAETSTCAAFEERAQDLQSIHHELVDLLDSGHASLTHLSAVWGGSGSEAYQRIAHRWNLASRKVHQAMNDLAASVQDEASIMGAAGCRQRTSALEAQSESFDHLARRLDRIIAQLRSSAFNLHGRRDRAIAELLAARGEPVSIQQQLDRAPQRTP